MVRVLVYMLAVPLAWYLGTFNFNGYSDANLMYIKRDFCVKIVMKNVRKLQIKVYKT